MFFGKHMTYIMLTQSINMRLGTKNNHSIYTNTNTGTFCCSVGQVPVKVCACVEVLLYKRGNACGGSDGDRWFGDKSAWESGSLPWD